MLKIFMDIVPIRSYFMFNYSVCIHLNGFYDNVPAAILFHIILNSDILNSFFLCIKVVAEKCDLFTGDWIPNPSGPVYTNDSCQLIEAHQNCMKNGRPDSAYLYWRWSPRDCELPQFEAYRFLELMRNKAWALIGDSITRNHIQSLLCILSKVNR